MSPLPICFFYKPYYNGNTFEQQKNTNEVSTGKVALWHLFHALKLLKKACNTHFI